jgi:hypothetical protein
LITFAHGMNAKLKLTHVLLLRFGKDITKTQLKLKIEWKLQKFQPPLLFISYSIVMTTCSTVLALGMMPLLLFLYCHGFNNLENAVPYTGITITLIMTLVPCAIGIAINHRVPQYSQIIIKVSLTPDPVFLVNKVTHLRVYKIVFLIQVHSYSIFYLRKDMN